MSRRYEEHTTKRPYRSEESAKHGAKRQKTEHGIDAGDPYRCDFCPYYHNGHDWTGKRKAAHDGREATEDRHTGR